MEGFCALELKPFGPVQKYVAPATVEAESWSVAPAQIGPLFDAAGAVGAALTVRIPTPVANWASGLVIVTLLAPVVALTVESVSVTCVGSVKLTLFTTTPPVTDAPMRFAYPGPPVSGPGSKNSEPEDELPVIVTLVEDKPWQTVAGDALDGVAGGGALSWTTRTAQVFAALQYSWNVQMV